MIKQDLLVAYSSRSLGLRLAHVISCHYEVYAAMTTRDIYRTLFGFGSPSCECAFYSPCERRIIKYVNMVY